MEFTAIRMSAKSQLDLLVEEILQKRSTGKMTWQAIADDYGINRAMARLIALGYQPGKKVRKTLGLPPSSTIILVGGGEIPDGSQAIRARQCVRCGAWYIPNHPRRAHCFVCRPARTRRKA